MFGREAELDANAGQLGIHVGEEAPNDRVEAAVAQPAERTGPVPQTRPERWDLGIGDGVRTVADAGVRDAMALGGQASAEHESVGDDHVGREVLERRLDVVQLAAGLGDEHVAKRCPDQVGAAQPAEVREGVERIVVPRQIGPPVERDVAHAEPRRPVGVRRTGQPRDVVAGGQQAVHDGQRAGRVTLDRHRGEEEASHRHRVDLNRRSRA